MSLDFSALTQRQLADMHGCDVRTIRRWDEEGHPRNADGTYNSVNSIGWRMQRESGSELDLNAERARLAKEQADKTALDNAARRGLLLEVDTVARAWMDIFTAIRARSLSLPTKVAAELAALTDANRIRDRLTDEVHQILAEAAAYRPSGATPHSDEADGDGDCDSETAATADGESVGGRKPKAKSGKQRRAGSVAH